MCVGVCVGVCLWEGLCVCVYGGDAVAARVAQSDMALAKRCARNPRSKSHLPLHRALLAERRHEELRETLQGAAQVAGRNLFGHEIGPGGRDDSGGGGVGGSGGWLELSELEALLEPYVVSDEEKERACWGP